MLAALDWNWSGKKRSVFVTSSPYTHRLRCKCVNELFYGTRNRKKKVDALFGRNQCDRAFSYHPDWALDGVVPGRFVRTGLNYTITFDCGRV